MFKASVRMFKSWLECSKVGYKVKRGFMFIFCPGVFFLMIAGQIDRNINTTIFVYAPAQRFKRMFFPLKLPEGWMFSKVRIGDNANSLLNLVETNIYEVGTSRHHNCVGFSDF